MKGEKAIPKPTAKAREVRSGVSFVCRSRLVRTRDLSFEIHIGFSSQPKLPARGAPKSVNVSWEACRAQQVASRPSRLGFTAGGDGAGSGRTRGEAGSGGHPPRHRGPS